MEPPPLAPPLTTTPPQPLTAISSHLVNTYPDSNNSSPRSRKADSWEDPPAPPSAAAPKLRLMCSYGGHIVPRPHDKCLCYVGGDTRIVIVERTTSLSSLTNRLSATLLNSRPFTLKYQLPSEDLDSLISVSTDEDLDNMIDEYDRTMSSSSTNSNKPSRIRLFLFPLKPESTQSMGPMILESSVKSEDWFLSALNGVGMLNRGFSDSNSVNCLLGLDEDGGNKVNGGINSKTTDSGGRDGDALVKSSKQQQQQGGQDMHSIPDSPMLDTTSSFGSTSSSPCLVNLPPIKVHVEDGGGAKAVDQKVGIEEQLAQINIGGGVQRQQQLQDDGFGAISSPQPPMPAVISVSVVPVTTGQILSDSSGRVFSDDERSDQSIPAGYRKPPTPQPQTQNPSLQQRINGGGHEIASPDSASSDNSITNLLSRQKPMIYQDSVVQIPPMTNMIVNPLVDPKIHNVSDPNARQIQDSGYLLPHQFEQQQQQFMQAPAPTHYLNHHPAGAMQIPGYYPVYPTQQQQQQQQPQQPIHQPQLDQQYSVYYMPVPMARQPQPYNLPMQQQQQQQPSVTETATGIPSSQPQTPPHPTAVAPPPIYNQMRNVKPEMAASGVYRTISSAGPPQYVQIPSNQQQYMGYSQIHHPSQSVISGGATGNYGYEYSDPARAQIYYSQPLAPAQYQTMVMPDASSTQQLSNEKIQQMRSSSQPL